MRARVKKLSEPKRFKDLRFVDFKVIKEPWNTYRLEDKSTISAKLVLTNVIADGNLGESLRKAKTGKKRAGITLAIKTELVAAARIPKSLRGPSSTPSEPEEGAPVLVKEDIDFDTISEKWNKYRLEHGVELRIKNTLVRVDKTNRHDDQGVPIYNVEGSAIVKITPPK
jgi:hypothetical protein